jgi:nicotinamide-nucleotide amidase
MLDAKLAKAARRVLDVCRANGLKVATAESCTGGLVTAALTEIAGSSDVVDRGFVTYSNAAKQTMLGVPAAMAKGALAHSDADLAVAITGIAGPGGGSVRKPVGIVYLAALARDGRRVRREKRYGKIGRRKVRLRSVAEALAMLELLAGGGYV